VTDTATEADLEQERLDAGDDWPEGDDRASIEDKADAGEGEAAKPDGPPPIAGVSRQLSLIAGGEEPDGSEFKMRGGSVPVEGEFKKGDVIEVVVKLSVDEVAFIDKKDNDGYVTSTTRRHIAKPLSIRRTEG
jgi:hypothetical protein